MPSIANTSRQSVIEVTDHLSRVRGRIAAAARQSQRSPQSIRLLPVSKGQPTEKLVAARAAGVRAFGENYVAEAVAKQDEMASAGIDWYFIGRIQSNKTRPIAERFDWVLSVDSERVARRLAAQRPEEEPALNVCLQVKTRADDAKAGVALADAGQLAATVASLPRLVLRGIMVIPPAESSREIVCECFDSGRQLFVELCEAYPEVDTLSMGMSGDLEDAIAAGSTLVRIGTDIFGKRKK